MVSSLYIYIYIYIYTHTYTYTHTFKCSCLEDTFIQSDLQMRTMEICIMCVYSFLQI